MAGGGVDADGPARRRSLAVFAMATVAMMALSGLGYLAYTEYLVPGYERLVFDEPMDIEGRVRFKGYIRSDASRVVAWDSRTGEEIVVDEYLCRNATVRDAFSAIVDMRHRSTYTGEEIVPMDVVAESPSTFRFKYYDGYDMGCGHESFGFARFDATSGDIEEEGHVT